MCLHHDILLSEVVVFTKGKTTQYCFLHSVLSITPHGKLQTQLLKYWLHFYGNTLTMVILYQNATIQHA